MFKVLCFFSFFTLLSFCVQSQTLKNANITFHTTNDDKDDDTHVTIEIKDGNGVVAARVDNDYGHFDDNSNAGPYGIPVRNASTRADCVTGSIIIHIDPNGHDHWNFDFDLTLVFSDGTTLSGTANGISLDQNRKEQTFGLNGILK